MRKEFVEKGGKVEKHFLEFAFFFIWSTQGKKYCSYKPFLNSDLWLDLD